MQSASGGRTRQLVLLVHILGAAGLCGITAAFDSMQLMAASLERATHKITDTQQAQQAQQTHMDAKRSGARASSDSLGLMHSEPKHTHKYHFEPERLQLSEAGQVEPLPGSASDSLGLILDEPASQFKYILQASDHDDEHLNLPNKAVDEVLIGLHHLSTPAGGVRDEVATMALASVAVLFSAMSGAIVVFAASTCKTRRQPQDRLRSSRPDSSSAVGATELFLCPISCEVMTDPVVTAAGKWNGVARSLDGDSECGSMLRLSFCTRREHVRTREHHALASHKQYRPNHKQVHGIEEASA